MSPAASMAGRPETRREGSVAFAGHRILADGDAEEAMRRDMDAVLLRRAATVGYGSMACGADILWAEALLERGATVHVILPFDPDEFVEISVRPGGGRWVERHHAVLAAAASVTVIWDGPYDGHGELFGMATDLYLGLARLHADEDATTPGFVVAWDREDVSGPAGTGADVARWRRVGGAVEVVEPRGTRVPGSSHARRGPAPVVGAALMIDAEVLEVPGEHAGPDVLAKIGRAVGAALDAAGATIRFRSDEVDGTVAVLHSSASAAGLLALELCEATERVVAEETRSLGLRVIAHSEVMPASPEPLDEWSGALIRDLLPAAQVVRRAPTDVVYATEPFAARLALDPVPELVAERIDPRTAVEAHASLYRLHRRADRDRG